MTSTFAELCKERAPSLYDSVTNPGPELTPQERQQLRAQLDASLVAEGDVCHVCGKAAVSPGADFCSSHAPRYCEDCGAEMEWDQTPSGPLCWTCLNKIY